MQRPGFEAYPVEERFAWDGSLVITRRQIALLHGLLDRPDACVGSYADWVRAARPYLTNRSPGALMGVSLGAYKVPYAWAARLEDGARPRIVLTARGRDILERRIQCRVRGFGVYRGLAAFRNGSAGRDAS